MAVPRLGNIRHKLSISILAATLSGIFLGFAGFIIKIALFSIPLDSEFVFNIVTTPLTYFAAFFGIGGFLLFQMALYKGKVSIVAPIVSGLSIVFPILLAVAFLTEVLSIIKIAGIIIILLGVIGLRK